MFLKLSDLLPKEASRRGMGNVITATQVCHEFRQLMPKWFTPEAEEYLDAQYFKEGVLTVRVTSGIWSKAVLMRKTNIIRDMNAKMGGDIIRKIRTQLAAEAHQQHD
jgi:predicted nucleic acid-binding Zn ribbon protein